MTREEIARILKQLRIDAGLTQNEAAATLGRKQQTLASWETGQSQPDANTLFNLCEIYGASVDEAFGFTTKKVDLNKHERELIEAFRAQPHLQEAVEKILGIFKEDTSTFRIAARDGQADMALTKEQRKALGKVVEESKKDDNSDLI